MLKAMKNNPFITGFFATLVLLTTSHVLMGEESHAIGKNAVVIEDTCITINWDATPEQARSAIKKWQELKNKE